MQEANTVLNVLRERGRKGQPVERLYRQLFNRDLFLMAYSNLYGNTGAMTPGVTKETVDGMSLAKIDRIIQALRSERYRWTPVRRTYIAKKNSTKKRPLGLPTWSDKLVQEVIRLLLGAYYEPQFSPHSHGFRPGRGCHTALKEIQVTFKGAPWFIEGDIRGCFDNIDHEILLSILAEKIKDNRFLRLIESLLHAGYLENWTYHKTLSGVPQGGIVSPLLSNIFMDRLDQYVEKELMPRFTKGDVRQKNKEYARVQARMLTLRRKGKIAEAKEARKLMQSLPHSDTHDSTYRRLRYVRYADDFLLAFTGTRSEAEEVKKLLGEYLKTLGLKLSPEKTLITHARSQKARFLGYDISISHQDTHHTLYHRFGKTYKGRSINGMVRFSVPYEVITEKAKPFLRNDKPHHRAELIRNSVFSILKQYQAIYRGIVNYYRMAHDLRKLSRLGWIMERSLTATIAAKLKTSRRRVYFRYKTKIQTEHGMRNALQVIVQRKDRKPLVATWGGVSLVRDDKVILEDTPPHVWNAKTEVLERMLADTCELCGSQEKVEVHHIRALKDLNQNSRKQKPEWEQIMAARQRKTMVVCHVCHVKIHTGDKPNAKTFS
jgi:group II intron reverse transcriptase/maturase